MPPSGSTKLAHAIQRFQDILGRVGVGQPQIAFAENAEVRPPDQRDAGVVEHRGGERLCLPPGSLDVGECIEGALRHDAAHAGQLVQPFDHDLAALVELRDHLVRGVLRAGKRGEACELRRRVDAGIEVHGELARLIVELARPYRVAEAPAGHRIGL